MEILPLATMFKFFYYPNFIFNWIQKKKKPTNKQTKHTVATTALCISSAFPYLFYLRETYLYEVMVFKKKKSTKSHYNISQVVSNVFFIEASLSLFIIGTLVMTLIVENSSQELVDWKPAINALQMNALEWMHLKI